MKTTEPKQTNRTTGILAAMDYLKTSQVKSPPTLLKTFVSIPREVLARMIRRPLTVLPPLDISRL
jgi:hypothetical protein